MKISVIGYARFKAFMGNRGSLVVEIEKGTLRDVLETLCEQFGKGFEDLVFDPKTKKEKRSNLILLNGQSHLNLRARLQIELKDGDEVTLLPTLIGG
jgi:molybdopterin converting factor small subunit